jgi:hypothetical protein
VAESRPLSDVCQRFARRCRLLYVTKLSCDEYLRVVPTFEVMFGCMKITVLLLEIDSSCPGEASNVKSIHVKCSPVSKCSAYLSPFDLHIRIVNNPWITIIITAHASGLVWSERWGLDNNPHLSFSLCANEVVEIRNAAFRCCVGYYLLLFKRSCTFHSTHHTVCR